MVWKAYQGIVAVFILMLCGCVKDQPPTVSVAKPNSKDNIYIVCEGNFGNGDATLYDFTPLTDSVFGDLYQAANGQPLGDVFESMIRIGNDFFLSVNNSDKIIIVDAGTLKQKAVIHIFQPRYILPVSSSTAYVSTLYSNKVYVINTTACTIVDSVMLPTQNAEGMCLWNGYVFTSSWDTTANQIYEINPATNTVIQRYTLPGVAPEAVLTDKDQMLWVLAGDQPDGKIATLTRLDPSTGAILKSFTFNSATDPLKPVFNNTLDTLYFIEANYYGGTSNNGIFRMSIYDNTLPALPFVPAGSFQYFWALGVDPLTGNIFVGDPKGFTQKGTAFIYLANGQAIDSFSVGLGPGHFYFDE